MAAKLSRSKIQPASGRIMLERNGSEVQTVQFAARLLDRPVDLAFRRSTSKCFWPLMVRRHWHSNISGRAGRCAGFTGAGDWRERFRGRGRRLQVYRNVYYTPPTHAVKTLERQLGPDEYFILGDNSPISVDSRSWRGGETVPRRLFVGRVLNR